MIEFGVKSLPSVAQGGEGFHARKWPCRNQKFYSVKTAFHVVKQAPPAGPDGLPLRGSPVATTQLFNRASGRDPDRP